MSKSKKFFITLTSGSLISLTTFFSISPAQAQIDVRHLQTCLKEEGSSLDVLVLMDSSKSLRDATPAEEKVKKRDFPKGSDPEQLRGKVLKSSLKILRTLAEESDRSFNISLRNFGKNSSPEAKQELMERWVDWTPKTSDNDLKVFVEKAVYDDSPGTEWTNGIISARDQFQKRINEAKLAGTNSCSIMFWITDGAPSDSKAPICAPSGNASINWFRENNILVLGGLLIPTDPSEVAKASEFGPLVRGETCGDNKEGWTKGEVIEATGVSDLAWRFVGLIAGIKNLIDLNGNGSSFNVDPSTSHIEIYTREIPGNWEIKKPDGTVFCSQSNQGTRCDAQPDPEVGITTITIFPDKPIDAAGTWTISPSINSEDFLVYGGLSTTTEGSRNTKPNLVIQSPLEVEEGEEASFLASLVNPDGSAFSLSGYSSISICAKVESSDRSSCATGKTSTNLSVIPSSIDRSVAFEAVLVSQKDPSRKYRISATARITVVKNGIFPSLVCEKDPCVLTRLANKNDRAVSRLEVKAPTSGSQDGSVTIVSMIILADSVAERGDGRFNFEIKRETGDVDRLNDQTQVFRPGEKLVLTASTDVGGSSEIQGVIKYKVSANGQEIIRQIEFSFDVGDDKSWWLLMTLILLAYLVTVGLPYAYLLWSARRRAVLTVSDNQYAFLEEPVTITENGKVVSKASTVENAIAAALDPSHEGLKFEQIEEGARSVSIGGVVIEVIPPKWNPFVEPATHVYVEGNHVMSTYGGSEFFQDRAFFSRSLTGEAVIYFPSEQNLAPVKKDDTDELDSANSLDLFAPTTQEAPEQELVLKSGEILATALFIVPRYGDRGKSMREVNQRLKDTVDSAKLIEHIGVLRKNSLVIETMRIEELQKANLSKSGKKSRIGGKVAENDADSISEVNPNRDTPSFFEDRTNDSENIFFTDEGDNPEPGTGKKIWE
jgi:hypothetical protein